MSSIVWLCGTTTSQVGYSGHMSAGEISPRDRAHAISALFEAGDLPEETVSVPSPTRRRKSSSRLRER